jgi:hypothetical protein
MRPAKRGSIVLLAVVLAACGSSESPAPASTVNPSLAIAEVSSSPVPSSSPSIAPTATSTDTPTPTATSAPPAPRPTPQPWLAYRSKRFHYSIKYPPEWVVTPGTTKLADMFDDYVHYVYVSRDTVSTSVSLSLTQTAETNYMKSHFKARLLSTKSLTVGGWPARLLSFNAVRDGRKLYVQDLFLGKGQVGYFLIWWSDQGHPAIDKNLFKRIYTTFRRI